MSEPSCSAHVLRRDLNARAEAYAVRYNLPCELGAGPAQSLVFADAGDASAAGPGTHAHHGNFHPASYRAIRANPEWADRLDKAHSGWKRAWSRSGWPWRELDCAVSSDALLMNVFCYPRVLRAPGMAGLLGVASTVAPQFGVQPRLARVRNLTDTSEFDMQLGDLLVEAKLTETGFQKAAVTLLDRYAGWRTVLDAEALARSADGEYLHYQLIRGILAAAASGDRFCLLCDARRLDLREHWFTVLAAVRTASLRCRLVLLTWQELAAAVPQPLRRWLGEKYGITPPLDGLHCREAAAR